MSTPTTPDLTVTIARYGVQDAAVDEDERPWIKHEKVPDTRWQPVCFDVRNGAWTFIVHIRKPGPLGRRRHDEAGPGHRSDHGGGAARLDGAPRALRAFRWCRRGAQLLTGGELEAGAFLRPTIFGSVTDEMRIAREEIFGPVIVVMPFDDVEEITARANDSEYGLSASAWTRDVGRAHALAAAGTPSTSTPS